MEECITMMDVVPLSIFSLIGQRKYFIRMEWWPLNFRDRKIENVIIEIKVQYVSIEIDNLLEGINFE